MVFGTEQKTQKILIDNRRALLLVFFGFSCRYFFSLSFLVFLVFVFVSVFCLFFGGGRV